MYRNKLRVVILPIMIALAILLGMKINSLLNSRQVLGLGDRNIFSSAQGSKLEMILNMINYSYVDSVDIKDIEEKAIPYIIKDLDPHTVYIAAKDVQRANEGIVGNFGGIGVQFYKYKDTVTVVKVVPGGPSEKAGILDGDRIVKVNDSIVAGREMNTNAIMKMMRGEVGTKVELTIARRGADKPIVKKLTRGSIPVNSLNVAYMVNDTTGLIRVGTFGMNTYKEFMQALDTLSQQGMRKLIVDLRDNDGGVLHIAVEMIQEFLAKDKLILYTQGKSVPRVDYKSNGSGKYQDLPLTVLINESSASASEIFAGAIQDNDRGAVIGRRSFGKGLVQEPRMLPDGSALRLTVARYYIPSGRSIQKPYDKGKEEYYNDIYKRIIYGDGEFEEKDSIYFDENLKYKTVGGRTVYGGGGVMPDIFVPTDTIGYSKYFAEVRRSVLYEYTFDFMDHHRHEMKDIKDYKQLLEYLDKFDLVGEMVYYASRNGVKRNSRDIRTSRAVLENNIKAFIGRHTLDDEGFFPIYFMDDVTVEKAVNLVDIEDETTR